MKTNQDRWSCSSRAAFPKPRSFIIVFSWKERQVIVWLKTSNNIFFFVNWNWMACFHISDCMKTRYWKVSHGRLNCSTLVKLAESGSPPKKWKFCQDLLTLVFFNACVTFSFGETQRIVFHTITVNDNWGLSSFKKDQKAF